MTLSIESFGVKPVYSTKNCPNCAALKELLKKELIDVEEYDMRTPDVDNRVVYA